MIKLIKISNKRQTINSDYEIHGTKLMEFNSAKYLGVTIDSNLNWIDQCNNVYKKASFMLSFLERNFYKCPKTVKEQLFNALVRPVLEYGCCVWDPFKVYQIQKLELLNKRAARFITGNRIREHGNTLKNMKTLGWSPLSEKRAQNKLILFYKILNNQIHVPTDDLTYSQNPRRPLNFFVPQSSVDAHLYSFFPSTIRLWNSLPYSVKSSDTLSAFKGSFNEITIRASYF